MEAVTVCSGCGKTVSKDYFYCPWCGISLTKGYSLTDFDEVFSKLEKLQRCEKIKYIEKLKAELSQIEKDLDDFTFTLECKDE